VHAVETLRLLDAPPVTFEEYLTWPETTQPCEFVDGRPIMSPSAEARHQLAVVQLVVALAAAVPPDFDVLTSPIDWVLQAAPLRVRQPDIAVVAAAQARGARLTEPPLLAVEVLSPTSRERDLVTKRREYAAAGLGWYWLVDTDVPQILALRNTGGEFVPAGSAVGDEWLPVAEPFPVRVRPADLV
jgi:Uma2 family endonuclease